LEVQVTGPVPIYVINVDGHSVRLETISARAAALGMRLIRWSATTDAELDADTLHSGTLVDGVRVQGFAPWSGSEAACGISHIRLLRSFLSSGTPWAVVLEDDAVLLRRFPESLQAWRLPADAEIVLLNDRSTAGPVKLVAEELGYGKAVGGAGTDGYLISRSGASKLLHILDPLKDPLDFQMYSHFESVRANDPPPFFWRLPRNAEADGVELIAYRIEPPLIGHRDGDSVIGNARHPRARFYCRVLLGLEFGDDGATYQYGPPHAVARRSLPDPNPPGRFFTGVDVSHLQIDGPPATTPGLSRGDALDMLVDGGVNAVRVSAWVGTSTALRTDRLLDVAAATRKRALDLCVALHYSDTWADPGYQAKPAQWRALCSSELEDAVYTYTYDLVAALCRQDTPPAVVQVGNEITNGMLWAGAGQDDHGGGRLWRPQEEGRWLDYDRQWKVFGRLLRTGVAAVRAAAADWQAEVEVMVHIDTGAYAEQAEWWLRRAVDHGIDFDLVGLSFYPMWHDGATVRAVEEFGLLSIVLPDVGIVLAETAYPYRPPRDVPVTRRLEFPITPAGQHEYLATMLQALRGVPTGRGLFWWGAFFLNGADCFRAHALLDDTGQPMPALSAFAAGRQTPML
jgi:arabinogalactan endo-1,4-beta-galactosidase